MAAKGFMSKIQQSDPKKKREIRLPNMGSVVSVSNGEAEIDIGFTLADGTAQTMLVDIASGFNPEVGQTVAIQYHGGNPNAAYATAVGASAAIPQSSGNIDADTLDGNHASAFPKIVTKGTSGDPTGSEGLFCINTTDNTFKVYADGAWRQLASW